MPSASRHILFAGISFILVSMLYFLGLVLHLPFIIVPVLVAAALYFTGKWFYNKEAHPADKNTSWWALGAIAIALLLMVRRAVPQAQVHGEWDAWAIWNLHAKYLLYPEHWQQMMRNVENGHPDYPLGLPAFIAFCIRVCNDHFSVLIPFIISIAFSLAMPVLIFFNTTKRSFFIALVALYFFGQDLFYLKRGVAQYADTPLAFFFLCAVACIYYARENKQYITLAAFFAASCMWIKNEGAVLAAIFFLFNIDVFLKSKNLRNIAIAALIPFLVFAFHKFFYATGNDMVGGQGEKTLTYLSDKSRYKLIYDFFINNLNLKFFYLKIGILVYLVVTILRHRWPDRQFLMLFACLGAYMFFYVVSPNDLEWHLDTSQDRLMHQLMPAFMLVLAQGFSAAQLPFSKKTQ